MSTVTYVTYANFTDIGRDAWREGGWHGDAMAQPFADPSLSRDAYGFTAEHSLYGTYDIHEDGSGVVLRLDAATDPQHAPEVPLPDARLRRRASRPTCTRSTGSSRRASRSTT